MDRQKGDNNMRMACICSYTVKTQIHDRLKLKSTCTLYMCGFHGHKVDINFSLVASFKSTISDNDLTGFYRSAWNADAV